jgi:hypothetical protein
VPASQVSLQFTQTPTGELGGLSKEPSGTLTFSASDGTGETITTSCTLDISTEVACSSGSPIPFSNLDDGEHQIDVRVTNESGDVLDDRWYWSVDGTIPTIFSHSPSPVSLTAALDLTFSEGVTGVDAASVDVDAQAANVDVAGTVSRPTNSTATWTPSKPLVPGETYRVTFSDAITDAAGNSLTPTYFDVRAKNWVDNTSVAMTKLWDRDALAAASGGSFIVDRLAGSRAELTFTATAGQTVSVYGIRRPDGGYADVYLDGVKKATPSFYAASTTRARVYLSGALAAGKHTISIRPTGTKPAASAGSWVRVDNTLVGATTTQETGLKQGFRTIAAASALDGSYDQVVQKSGDTTPAQFRVTGVGNGIKVFATKTSTSGSARIYVDGVLKATVNLNAASTTYKALVYSAAFALGTHTVRVEAVGTATGANSAVNLDRITFN